MLDHFLTDREKKKRGLSLSYGAQRRLALTFNRRNDASSQQHREIILKTFHFAISRKLHNDAIVFFFFCATCTRRVYITSIFFSHNRSLCVVDFRYFTRFTNRVLEHKLNIYNFRDTTAIARVQDCNKFNYWESTWYKFSIKYAK